MAQCKFPMASEADGEFKTACVQPFNGIKNNTYIDANATWLELVDGGLNHENVPFGSLFVTARGVDFIIAADGR